MNKNEILDFMKPRISAYYYEILILWSSDKKNKSCFQIKPTLFGTGYIISYDTWWNYDTLIVYK